VRHAVFALYCYTESTADLFVSYNAPEVEEQGSYPIDRAELPKCDVWALGLLIWEACIGGEEYLTYLRRNRLMVDSGGNLTNFDQGSLLEFAKRSLPKFQFGTSMFLHIALRKALQKDPALRAPNAQSLPLYTRWK
jgi:serine/threonine protein kinase